MPALSTSRPELNWRSLRIFSFYRLIAAGLLLAVHLMGTGPTTLGAALPEAFLVAATAYVLAALVLGFTGRLRRPAFETQVGLQAAADIPLITAITYASGGVASGLGMLMVPVIAGLSLQMPGRWGLLFAALASLSLLGAEIQGLALGLLDEGAFTQTGLLGAGLFATALLAMALSWRARESEALALRHSIDLANMAELNAHIIDRMQSGVIVANDEGHIHLVNEAAWNLVGNPDPENPSSLADLSPRLYAALREWLMDPARGSALTLPGDNQGPELRVRFTRLGVERAVGTLLFVEDTAELRRQMQSAKMASVGRLTASIAHEIRNPLGAVSHAAQLLAESEDLTPPDKRLAGIIQAQSERMNAVIQSVLRLSRREEPRREEIELLSWITTFAREFQGHHHLEMDQVAIRITPADTRILFDPDHLHQVLWNLCDNALTYGAVPDERVRIELRGGANLVGRHASLDVLDNGPGVNPRIDRQLFEPFVTTGDNGTGLGLYISRELCENNGGSLDYLPLPSGGSCFRILFPVPEP
ncbi:two-component sensor histidine kinase [Thioalkalivibrio denitrificans]|uniref:histidine kinase n=1 Tax=Thioalkalivibrio denitrificans TaxID=108003 RepID=A0A1V3NEV8_9GAMM|nr:ATP-binding protein [Thioalkalivibrio denitrificans]OOG23591.1 two-component sensor histidine kinase [Thioalkalivibrio denitrificans]